MEVPGTWSTLLMPLRAIQFLCEHQVWEVSWSGITSLLCHLCHETAKSLPGPYHTHGSSARKKIPSLERCHIETGELAPGSPSAPQFSHLLFSHLALQSFPMKDIK